jgi:hypothetical protein
VTAATASRPARSLGDRYADITVIAVTALALLLGWALKSVVEARALPFEAAGVTAEVPSAWLRLSGSDSETELLRATNPASAGFGTTYIIDTPPVAAGATEAQVAGLLALSRGQTLTGYRVHDQQPVTVDGRNAYRVAFVYVESNPDLTHNELPQVVRGVDFIFLAGERAVVVTYAADQAVYEADYSRFRQFLNSVSF